MTWRKLGHLFAPSGELPWARSHAANPVPEHLEGNRFRVYFSARDEQNRSSIGTLVLDLSDSPRVVEVAKEPVLRPGTQGAFDDCGASVACLLRVGEARYLYYMGWHLTQDVPWRNAIGVAICAASGARFERYSEEPLIGLDAIDPHTISYPWVLRDGDTYRMWYGSNLKWGSQIGDMLHVIKYAESEDALRWRRPDKVVIDSTSPAEYAICRPCVLHDPDGWKMWFCSRGHRYRIHAAESTDGIEWKRLGEDTGIGVGADGWDSDMIEYPCVFDHAGRRYLLYVGNDYGRTGFGIAVLER